VFPATPVRRRLSIKPKATRGGGNRTVSDYCEQVDLPGRYERYETARLRDVSDELTDRSHARPGSYRHPVEPMASRDTAAGVRHYLEILRRHLRVVVAALVIVPLVAFIYSSLQTPAYDATSKVLLGRQNIAGSITGIQDPNGTELSDRPVQTQADLARVPEVVRRTLAAAKLTGISIPAFLASSTVVPAANSDILEFHVTNGDPTLAQGLVSAYAHQFTRYRTELDTAPARRARTQLQARIAQLRKKGDTSSRLYTSLANTEQQLATFEALQTSNAYVVQDSLGAVQVRPTKMKNMILGFGFGALLAVGLASLAHALDTRAKTVRSVEERLGVPLLGRLPVPPGGNGSLVMQTNPAGVHAEAFRVLRANFEFVNRGHMAQVVMVTSATEGEGKSTTISNLAVAFAREGKRVVAVDLDLRRPVLARLFGVAETPGVIEAAYGRVELDKALQSVTTNSRGSSLQVIPAGAHQWDAGEFMTSSQLKSLLSKLRSQADFVLIDAPPLLVSSDAVTLGSVVDGILLVTGRNSLRWEALDDVIRSLSMCAAPTLGWVVTGTEALTGYEAYTSANGRE
jgi:tyrosine-protein kinase